MAVPARFKHVPRWKPGLIGLVALCLLAACGPRPANPASRELTVFAASSLTDAFTALARAFEENFPDTQVTLNFAGSSTLAAQIITGAEVDVFASANFAQIETVIDAGLAAGDPVIFARNALVLVMPASNPGQIIGVDDLARPGLRLILAAPGVPIREYTDQVLARLAENPARGAAFRDRVLANVVSEETNVRQVVAKIALGEADAGFAYRSDVTSELGDRLTVLELPPEAQISATYALLPLTTARNPELAAAFVAFVQSESGQDILRAWGLSPADEDSAAS
ncbi:MAG: molybdate ABC transporter substrate-binding protein [Anaerolineae bacterium]